MLKAAPKGIVSLELAGTPQTARAILDAWKQMSLMLSAVAGQPNPDIVNVPYVFVAFGLNLHDLFMPIYVSALAFDSLLTARGQAGTIRS